MHACLHAQRGHRHCAVVWQGVEDGKAALHRRLQAGLIREQLGVHAQRCGLGQARGVPVGHRQAVATGLFEQQGYGKADVARAENGDIQVGRGMCGVSGGHVKSPCRYGRHGVDSVPPS